MSGVSNSLDHEDVALKRDEYISELIHADLHCNSL